MGDTQDARWMTFAELAATRDISRASASKLVRRRKWGRQTDNKGTVRILVPVGKELRSDHRPPDAAPASPVDSPVDNVSLVCSLQEAVALLREQLAQAKQRADRAEARAEQVDVELRHEREAARQLAKQIAGLSADLARLAAAPHF
jgi:hypothetical protein